MLKYNVRTPADALVYITDCNLATVESMAKKSKRRKFASAWLVGPPWDT